MTKSIQIIGLLAIIPLFTMGLATNFVIQDVEAYKDPYAKRSDADVTCRPNQVLVYHLQHNQYICTSSHGAAQWVQYGIAEIVGQMAEGGSTTVKQDRADFAKQSDERQRVAELEAILIKVQSGQDLTKSEERTLGKAYEFAQGKGSLETQMGTGERTPVAKSTEVTGGSMLQAVPKQQTSSQTLTSAQDPGMGHEGHQIAIILPPSDDVYIGRLSFSASEPVQYVSLIGPLGPGEDKGQPIWTPDGETKYAITIIDQGGKSGGYFFAGNALALHTMNPTPFTATVSAVYTKIAEGDYSRGAVRVGTQSSIPDPGIGHESHSIVLVLPPRDIPYQGGIISYSASEKVQLIALHGPLDPGDKKGQPTWSPVEGTDYALTYIPDEDNMGIWSTFSGNALAFHTENPDGFTVSYAVGGLH